MTFMINKFPSISKPLDNPTVRVLSLGAGVQSSTLALMASRGDIGPMPDYAVFADTKWEPKKVYEWLAWLTPQLAFPVYWASREGMDLGQMTLAVAAGEIPFQGSQIPPFFLAEPNGLIPKQCSKVFKTRVVSGEIRHRLGLKPGERAPKGLSVELWIGISLDELSRAKVNEIPWFTNRFPLLEAGMKRADCITYCDDRQVPRPPKSSCIFCPFRRKKAWKAMRDNEPEDFSAACAFDRAIRIIPGVEGKAYVSDDRVPLEDLDLDGDDGQMSMSFDDECEGACGV